MVYLFGVEQSANIEHFGIRKNVWRRRYYKRFRFLVRLNSVLFVFQYLNWAKSQLIKLEKLQTHAFRADAYWSARF